MVLSKNYIPASTEEKWYGYWMGKGYFTSVPDDRKPYTIVIPPPNVTGVLHMGHTLNETVQDILIRRARMNGFNACWVPGSDHASIATEARVVAMLKEKGMDKSRLSREEFLQYAFEWKEKYGGIIYHQIKKLGCSCDWNRVNFTMDDHYYKAVIKVFVDLYKKGLIYRGARMINWDPAAKTALSDEEVEYREVKSKLYYIRYPLEEDTHNPRPSEEVRHLADTTHNDYITVATTRPETILGDVAICINPTDERYQHLRGRFAFVPLINRRIPVIFDEYVDKEFGTGCLKVTPAHDINDYNLGLKYQLEVIDVLNEDGTMSEAAGLYIGEDRFAVRKKIAVDLQEKGFLAKEEEIINKNGFSQRTNAVVEPRISTQWFLKMEALAKPALEAVLSGEVRIHPKDRFINTYRHWMENVKDWCISRQLWWGQRIPAWYDAKGNVYVGETYEEAVNNWQLAVSSLPSEGVRQAADGETGEWQPALYPGSDGAGNTPGITRNAQQATHNSPLTQDNDVLDTWFSSWLWPMEVFKGITDPGNKDINYYYPASVLVTGQDIIFFWVARMIMAGLEYRDEIPFGDVYFTGMVRDKLGRKMSKSLGNSPDLLALIDGFGADAVRFGIMIASPAGNDLLFDEASCEQGRNFCNKMWNVLKLVKMWEERQSATGNTPRQDNDFAMDWFESRLEQVTLTVNELFRDFRLSEALKTIYSLIWDDFCSWYIEWIKPAPEQPVDTVTYKKTVFFLEQLMQLLHPFMPFVTEEIYHEIARRKEGDDLIIRQFENLPVADENILALGSRVQEAIAAIRDARNKNNIRMKEEIMLHIQTGQKAVYKKTEGILKKQVNASAILFTEEAVARTITLVVGEDKLYIGTDKVMDTDTQRAELVKDLAYQRGFLASIEKKLSNERFVQNARPEIVENERKKKADAEARIKAIEEGLRAL